MKRRTFLERSTMAAAGLAFNGPPGAVSPTPQDLSPIRIDPTPLFELSPYLYMQFMEPLGVTDGSVEAAWDHLRDDWRDDVVEVTRELAPTMMRWGGIFADFYRWREGVGPRDARPPMINLLWGGIESNQVGTGGVRGLLPAGGGRAAGLRELRIGRTPAIHEGQGAASAQATRRKRPRGWPIATTPQIAERKAHGSRGAAWNPALANRKRNFLRQERLRSRNRGAQDRRVREGDARGRSRNSGDCVGRQRLGGSHGGDRRENTRSTLRFITCSTPTRAIGRCCAASCIGATRRRPGIS